MSVSRLAARLLAVALCAAIVPAAASAQPLAAYHAPAANLEPGTLRGAYRVDLHSASGAVTPATILVERRSTGAVATMLVGDRATAMQNVRIAGDTLQATVTTDAGPATLMLRLAGEEIDGTLTVKRQKWTVKGERSA